MSYLGEASSSDQVARSVNYAVQNLQDDLADSVELGRCLVDSRHPMRKSTLAVDLRVAHISRLPSETLLSIFFLLMHSRRQEYFNVSSYSQAKDDPWDWMILAKVCSRWRSLALNYKIIWSDIVKIRDLEKLRVFLERSGRMDLYVDLFPIVLYEDRDALFDLLEKHMWRVREFRILINHGRFPLHNYVRCLAAASKRMKVLAIRHDEYSSKEEIPDLSATNPAIQLDDLSVMGFTTNWRCSLMVGLSELRLSFVSSGDDLNLPSFLDILEQSPMLRFLSLKSIWAEHFRSWRINTPPTHVRVINLPQLQSISLSNIPSHILFALLKSVKIPKVASLNISCPMYDSGYHDFTFLQQREACNSIHICIGVEEHTIFADPITDYWGLASNTVLSFVAPTEKKFVVAQEILLGHSFWQGAKAIDISFSEHYEEFIDDLYNDSDIEWDEILDDLPRNIERLGIGIPSTDQRINDYIDLLLRTLSKRTRLLTGQFSPQSEDTQDEGLHVFASLTSITIFGEEQFSETFGPRNKKILRHIGNSIQFESF